MVLRAEAQTRIERPLGSGVPSTVEDVDSTMPDNAARDAAIRDAARAADERAGMPSDSGSKRFGPPTLQSPNDGALPSSPAASLGGAVVDAILPSAAFARPDPPPTAPTYGGVEPPPLPAAWNAQPFAHASAFVGGGAVAGAIGQPGTAAMGPPLPEAWAGGPAGTGGHGAGSSPPYFPGAGGSAAPQGYLAGVAPSAPGSIPAGLPRKKGSGAAIVLVVAVVLVVIAIAVVTLGLLLRARGAQFPLGGSAPSASAPATAGKRGK